MTILLIAAAAFVGVAALVGGLTMLLNQEPSSKIEERLEVLTGAKLPGAGEKSRLKEKSLLAEPLDSQPGLAERVMNRVADFNLIFEQADTSLSMARLLIISAVLALLGLAMSVIAGSPTALLPLFAVMAASLPFFWLFWRRRRRLKAFAVQLPDALEMLSRSLRAGQSLASGFNLVANEVSAPLGTEFGRVFDEQNLGVAMEDSLRAMTDRIPNLDLKFFVTSVVLQRQTGGDLAEILDKIGSLIRERFQIWGQVQALTGEGRLSGIVLMALPVVLFVAVYYLNPEYVMMLFTDPLGKKMLAVAVVLQIFGALVIRKIVNIKV